MPKTNIIQPQKGFQEKFVRSNVDFAVGGGVLNCGKENPLDTKVLTPSGWTTMGELKIGDLVSTPFGGSAKVTKIFEHKDKDIYRITTNDGRSAECGYEHLWAIRTRKQLEKYRNNKDFSRNFSVVETSEIIRRLNLGKKTYIQTPFAQEFEERELPIPPYVFGVMLGDGCMSEKTWLNGTHILISSSEEDIIEKVCNIVKSERIYKQQNNYTYKIYTKEAGKYREYCQKEGLIVRSYLKHIPKIYLESSIEQRRELLYGLMDTDGCVEKKNTFSFSTSSEKMKDDFVYLCRSLGYQTRVRYDNRITNSGVGNYRIRILTPAPIFSSKKHLSKYEMWSSCDKKFTREWTHVYVTKIEKTRVADTRCIFIDDPLHLYIIDDFLTTHNTFSAVMSVAEPSEDPKFRALFLRNNLGDARASGGILDTFAECYGAGVKIVESGEPRVTFPSGAKCDVTHVSDQSYDKVMQRFKGRQFDFIYFDEGTGFTWECFTAIYTRNRGKGKWTGKVRMTTNPERDHWLRTFLDWYIGPDGYIRKDRDGKIRYFYMAGPTVKDVVWGNSKEEVYMQCKPDIDAKLKSMNEEEKEGFFTWKDIIQSFTFYLGKMSENKASIGNNPGYIGAVAMTGGAVSKQLLEGNWNVSTKHDGDAPIKLENINKVLQNDPQRNGDRWVTCDLADTGTDNFIALAWDGFHIEDILILSKSTPKMNADYLRMFAAEHDVPDNHIIYDAVRGTYMNDYIPDATPFVSYRAPIGLYGRMAMKLKDECYMRLAEVIKKDMLSFSDKVANKQYEHQMLKERIAVSAEFIEECSVVRFTERSSGKKSLLTKKEMNAKLGKSRSMDLLDPCAMRMLPVLQYPYGEELFRTSKAILDREDDETSDNLVDVYDESNWY